MNVSIGLLYDFKLEGKVNKKLYHNLRDPVVAFLWRCRAFQMSDYCQQSPLQLMYRVQGVGSQKVVNGTKKLNCTVPLFGYPSVGIPSTVKGY